jgi:hypothetical protein
LIFYIRSAANDGGVPNFSGFLLRPSGFAVLSRLQKVRVFQISHNVPVIYDVLTAAIRELRSNSSGGQNVPEKNCTKVRSPDCGFL